MQVQEITQPSPHKLGHVAQPTVKLGGNGKSTWMLKVKFVYKEGKIRKLVERLRDMKGKLATILMCLQVDLQLSLLWVFSWNTELLVC